MSRSALALSIALAVTAAGATENRRENHEHSENVEHLQNREHPENLENLDSNWPINGGVDNIRYSPLAQINRDNVVEAAGRLDLRLARRLQGLGNAEQPGRRRRRALRDDADAEGRRGERRDRPGSLEVRSERRRGVAARGSAIAASPSTRIACSSPTATCSTRWTGRRARRFRRSAPTDASTCARASGCRPSALSVSASTPGVVFEDLLIMGSSVPGDAARIARAHPRVRCEHRQAALDLPHHPAARRVRLRHAGRRTPTS